MNDELRQVVTPILLVGYGQMGTYYASCLFGRLGFKEGDVIAFDRDPRRRIDFTEKFPQALTVSSMEAALELKPKTAFVLVNSPEHLPVITQLLDAGITNILVEKPLVLTTQLDDLLKHPRIMEANLITAYLISFSLAVQKLMEFMREHGLVVVEGRGLWGKNRIGDSRPTAGDWEDEATHPLCTILQLIALNEGVVSGNVSAWFSRLPYTDSTAQQQAAQRDASYEVNPISSSCVAIDVRTEDGRVVPVMVNSSFVAMDQERRVEVVLARRSDHSRQIAYLARIDFDVAKGDLLHVWRGRHDENVTSERFTDAFDKNVKLQQQIEAFLHFVTTGQKSARLVTLTEAVSMVNLSAEALISGASRAQ